MCEEDTEGRGMNGEGAPSNAAPSSARLVEETGIDGDCFCESEGHGETIFGEEGNRGKSRMIPSTTFSSPKLNVKAQLVLLLTKTFPPFSRSMPSPKTLTCSNTSS
jgi:hypothetical protein